MIKRTLDKLFLHGVPIKDIEIMLKDKTTKPDEEQHFIKYIEKHSMIYCSCSDGVANLEFQNIDETIYRNTSSHWEIKEKEDSEIRINIDNGFLWVTFANDKGIVTQLLIPTTSILFIHTNQYT